MHALPLILTDDGDRVARFPDSPWLLEVRRIDAAHASATRRSPDGESLWIVLGGTHDLFAGGGSWIRRGLRKTPFDAGRPVAVYLPPGTRYHSEHGDGPTLVVSVRQPALPIAETPRDELARKPLLQMSGSGKAFDPVSGAWKPQEAFLSSPEAILPRRIARVTSPSGATIERLADVDYKTLGLGVDEAMLAPGQCVSPPAPAASSPVYPTEIAVYCETEGRCAIGDVVVGAEDGPTIVRIATGAGDGLPCVPPRVEAQAGRAYVVFVYAGTKAST